MRSRWLFAAGVLNLIAALLHIGCIVFGAPWYRAFGAGPRMVHMVERGAVTPGVIAALIAAILTLWAAYAFSGAGVLYRPPLLRTGLITITTIYLLRAAALPWMLAYAVVPGRGPVFLILSSAIVLVFGLVHAIGLWASWDRLAPQPR